MLIVRVELHSAVTGQVTEIARSVIHNVGGDSRIADYECAAFRGRDRDTLTASQNKYLTTREAQRKGKITAYLRRDLHVWNLVSRALTTMGYA